LPVIKAIPNGVGVELFTLENHKYIKLIEFAINQNNFTKIQACENSGLTTREFDFVRHEFFILSAAQAECVNDHQESEWTISSQAFFHYLQFSEFKFAVTSAEKAQRIAVIAVAISAILAISSIITTVLN
jgi:hypothetical protein